MLNRDAKMTEKADEDKSVLIRMRVSPRLHAYLGLLARKTLLGTAENDVAEYLLTQRLEVMLAEKYHEKQAVPDTDG